MNLPWFVYLYEGGKRLKLILLHQLGHFVEVTYIWLIKMCDKFNFIYVTFLLRQPQDKWIINFKQRKPFHATFCSSG